MSELLKKYRKEVVPMLQKELSIKNPHAVPHVTKVVVNIGVGRVAKEEKIIEQIVADLALITGQKPVATVAKKAIASFKTREGMVIGYKVTLRGNRMYDFLERLLKIALPRTRDFRGLSIRSIQDGTLTIGVKEHIVFPEVSTENVRNIFSFEITIVTTAKNKQNAEALFKGLGFPFAKAK